MKKILSLLTFITFISIITIFQSCKKENTTEPVQTPTTLIADNTIQIDSSNFKTNLLSIDSSKIVYGNSNSFTQSLVVGGFLVSDYNEGVLRKIVSIQTQGNQIIVNTRQAYLDEVIIKGKIEFEGELNLDKITFESSTNGFKVVKKNDNIAVSFLGIGIGANKEVNLDINTEFTPPISKLFIELDHGLKYFEASVKITNITTQKTTTTSGAFVQGEYTPEWATIKFPGFFIPGTLIWIIPKIKFGLGCQAAIENAITNEIQGTVTLYGGIKYENGQWSTIKTINNTFSLLQTTTNSFGQIVPYLIAPRFGFYIGGIAGPFIDSRFYGKFVEGIENGNPYYAQYAGIKVNAGVEAKILSVGLSYSATLFDFENELVKVNLGTPPTVTTTSITNPTSNSAIGGGNVIEQGSSTVTARGVCWSTSQNPTTTNDHTSDGTGTGSFTSLINGLNLSTPYYVRAYATNSSGTSYGSQVSFTTSSGVIMGEPCPGTPTVLYEGITYSTVLIGTQCWLKKNLNVGNMVDSLQNQNNNSIIEKYCYNNLEANCTTYGGLYQWNEAMQYTTTEGAQGICPDGWHIPTRAEFLELSSSVLSSSNKLKEIGQGIGAGAGNNGSGFSGLLAGFRGSVLGSFSNIYQSTRFWSSTQSTETNASHLALVYDHNLIPLNANSKLMGLSIRCLKD